MAQLFRARPRTTLAEQNQDATHFYLIESGEVGVYREGEYVALITAGGYIGEKALLDTGVYSATYRALSEVTALTIARDQFDPLLRADTTLASQVSAGAETRQLLRRMPLFRTLSPQELMMVDRRLRLLTVTPGN
ncbi:MAG: cyclic nucleotide-binding domain-containing protein [Chloroflexi bacterium]|nr:cyclic nucleotide-binding domain-containing protein [Chloroflexota bacterium]